jgi:hypothetical protein
MDGKAESAGSARAGDIEEPLRMDDFETDMIGFPTGRVYPGNLKEVV